MSKNVTLYDYLYQVVKDAQAADRDDVCKWILRHMKQEEEVARPKRSRKVRLGDGDRLVSGGSFYMRPEMLRQSAPRCDCATTVRGNGPLMCSECGADMCDVCYLDHECEEVGDE